MKCLMVNNAQTEKNLSQQELLNECRRYGIYNEVREFANKKAAERQEHIDSARSELTAMTMSADHYKFTLHNSTS
jgi:hypothetical protein